MNKDLSQMEMYNFDTRYIADTEGNVFFNYSNYKVNCGDKVKPFINIYGYVEYTLRDRDNKQKHIQAHRIVACLYLDNPLEKKYVNHKDGNKQNNSIHNLEWVTASENEIHSYQVLNKIPWNKGKELPKGCNYLGNIRTVAKLSLEGEILKIYFNPTEATLDGFNLKQISATCLGRQQTHKGFKWKYIEN